MADGPERGTTDEPVVVDLGTLAISAPVNWVSNLLGMLGRKQDDATVKHSPGVYRWKLIGERIEKDYG